jgi:16S rRNA (guanine527-N7)-methyltransferase
MPPEPLAPLGQGFVPLVNRTLSAVSAALATEPGGANGQRTFSDTAAIARIAGYLDALVEWNQRTDLTAARSTEELVDLFVADAAVLAALEPGGSWVDVGAGAGAPGLVASLLRDDLRVTLVEPKDRRVAFMRSMIGKFSLTRASVERARSDRLPARGWDVAVSRATLSPADWLREGARLSRGAVWVLLAKDEPPELRDMRVDVDVRYQWPLTGVARRALRYSPTGPGPQ